MTTCLVASIAAQQNTKRIMRINMVSSRFVVMKYENRLSLSRLSIRITLDRIDGAAGPRTPQWST